MNKAVHRIGPRVGVNPDTLRTWAKQAEVDAGRRAGKATAEIAEIIVGEAVAAIREERASTIVELTRQVAASRSSLYRSFDVVLGVSPYTYIQTRRLVRLRRRLLELDAEPGLVTGEAANVGTFHLGNLAPATSSSSVSSRAIPPSARVLSLMEGRAGTIWNEGSGETPILDLETSTVSKKIPGRRMIRRGPATRRQAQMRRIGLSEGVA